MGHNKGTNIMDCMTFDDCNLLEFRKQPINNCNYNVEVYFKMC